MTYLLKPIDEHGAVMVVGCGGTGGFVAEGLCRLLAGSERDIILIDHDRVKKENLGRQNFYEGDLGRFKAQVLAERLGALFSREILYDTRRIEELSYDTRGALTIGCVDNPGARRRLEIAYIGVGMNRTAYSYQIIKGWYIDAGNGEHSGQVLIGNSLLKEICQRGVSRPFIASGIVERLPLPTVQQPALLSPENKPRRRNDCAARVARQEQSRVINKWMADIVITFVDKLLEGKLQWMGAYVDLERGSVRFIDAEPEAVSRITGISVNQLEYYHKKVKDG